MPNTYNKSTFSESFFKPIIDVFSRSDSRRSCHAYPDLEHIKVGIERVISQAQSGRDFIQELGDLDRINLSVSHFFKSLKSKRRLANLISVNTLLKEAVNEKVEDPFSEYQELRDWEIFAVDGHYQEHATHDPIFTGLRGKQSRVATGHFFRLDLRTHHMSVLDTIQPAPGMKKEHDAKVIQRMTAEEMRYHAPKGRKVLLVWDKACIDYHSWRKLKHQHGTYFVTMEKSNTAAMNCSGDLCDHTDPRNEGIKMEMNVGIGGEMMRRIIYENPIIKGSGILFFVFMCEGGIREDAKTEASGI